MLTAKQLKITPSEREALITLREALLLATLPQDFRFTMALSASGDGNCGTAACIGGSIALMTAVGSQHDVQALHQPQERDMKSARAYVEEAQQHPTLAPLFYPAPLGGGRAYPPYSIYTKEDAANAIANFLHSGDPDWATAAAQSIEDYLTRVGDRNARYRYAHDVASTEDHI